MSILAWLVRYAEAVIARSLATLRSNALFCILMGRLLGGSIFGRGTSAP